MATTQELLNLKYDYAKAELAYSLQKLFSPLILEKADALGYTTFEEIITLTALDLNEAGYYGSNLIGVEHLKLITLLEFNACDIVGNIDISRNTALQYLVVPNNSLENIWGIGNCVNLLSLNAKFNELSSINLQRCTSLTTLSVSYNPSLTFIGNNVANLVNLTGLIDLRSCAIPTDFVNIYLRNFADIATTQNATSLLITQVNLHLGTNGVPSGDGLVAKAELEALGVVVNVNV